MEMATLTLKIQTPTVPNYLFIDDGFVGQRQDGFKEKPKYPISHFTDEQLIAVADNWKAALLERANMLRNGSPLR